jgi:cysteinyl-tRNA synthetase
MLKIYNSLTRKKEIFKPINPGKIDIYVCGVTVYDFCHLGNARTYAAFDVIIRYLRSQNFAVNYVRNITDIDDKIIKRANERKVDFQDIVTQYTQAMHDDLSAIGLLLPDKEPKATETIPQIITLIEKLIKDGHAYVAANGDVYYDVRKFKNYGCLAHRDIDKLESGARVEINDVKNDPLDFVLWKLAKPEEPKWQSPWGEGRPGWHIECSAMATTMIGPHFDIHGGGRDLIFPHHENEIAQSEAATGEKFVNVWMHAGFLQIEKEKMSKSLGNFFTLRDLLKKYAPEVLRYFLITSHYRSSLAFSEDVIQQSHSALARFYTALRDLPQAEAIQNSVFEEKFLQAMNDDFNTPIAFSVLFELAHEIQRLRDKDIDAAAQHGALLKKLGGILGILQDNPEVFLKTGQGDQQVDAEQIEKLIAARNKARAEKNWSEADRIRDELSEMSVVLEDAAGVTSWKVF